MQLPSPDHASRAILKIQYHFKNECYKFYPIQWSIYTQVIKTFSTREGWWYIGIKGDGGVKSKGTRLLIEKEK